MPFLIKDDEIEDLTKALNALSEYRLLKQEHIADVIGHPKKHEMVLGLRALMDAGLLCHDKRDKCIELLKQSVNPHSAACAIANLHLLRNYTKIDVLASPLADMFLEKIADNPSPTALAMAMTAIEKWELRDYADDILNHENPLSRARELHKLNPNPVSDATDSIEGNMNSFFQYQPDSSTRGVGTGSDKATLEFKG